MLVIEGGIGIAVEWAAAALVGLHLQVTLPHCRDLVDPDTSLAALHSNGEFDRWVIFTRNKAHPAYYVVSPYD